MAIGRTKQFNSREFSKLLINNGFTYEYTKGSHAHYKRGNQLVVLPTRNANKMLCRRIVKEFNLEM